MTILDILRLPPNPDDQQTEPVNTGFGRRRGDALNHSDLTPSRRADDLSRHESKPDQAPKHEPKVNHRERPKDPNKPATQPSHEQNKLPGSSRK